MLGVFFFPQAIGFALSSLLNLVNVVLQLCKQFCRPAALFSDGTHTWSKIYVNYHQKPFWGHFILLQKTTRRIFSCFFPPKRQNYCCIQMLAAVHYMKLAVSDFVVG